MKGSSGYSPVSKTDDDDDGHDTITRLEAGETTGRARPPGAAVASDEEAMDEDFVTLRRNRPTTVVVVALAILFAILLIAAVHTFGFPGTPGSDGLLAPLPSHPGDSTMSGQDEPQAIGGSTSNPAVVPHYTWDGKKCFVDNAELREAVDSYLLNKSNDTLEAVYGLPIGRWCVRYVESFSLVFASQGRNFTYPDRADNLTVLMERFNDDITGWDVTGAKDLDRMFRGAKNFNQDLSGWDVSRVESMLGTFEMTNRFDGDIRNWDVSKVKVFNAMFYKAVAFGRNLAYWNVTSAQSMKIMFRNAHRFDHDMCRWASMVNVSYYHDIMGMFMNSGCPTETMVGPFWGNDPRWTKPGPWCHSCE